MNNKEEQFKLDSTGGNNTHLLRVGVIFLSVVSFFTTANGMKEYIFVDNGAIAYAASAAIQGILLALSMNLPGYLRGIWSRREQTDKDIDSFFPKKIFNVIGVFLIKSILSICALLLTVVTIFCSTWFSYIYIADIIHKDSWGIDSSLLVQQTYRSELYNARDYVHAYRFYLEESVGEKILLLEEQAAQLSGSVAGLAIDYDAERQAYVLNRETTAASYMTTVIDAMENAMKPGASQEAIDLAVSAVRDAKTNAENRRDSVQQNIDTLDGNITKYNEQIESLTNRVRRATANTDVRNLNNSINTYTNLIDEASQQQAALETEKNELDRVLQRLPYYESQLGLSSSTSATSIRSDLLDLQSEFFQQEPNEEKMLTTATKIFESLRTAANAPSVAEDEVLSYSNLLEQMNRLIRNLTDYSEIKEIESNLGIMISDLRTMDTRLVDEANSVELMSSEESPVPEDDVSPEQSPVPEEAVKSDSASGIPNREAEPGEKDEQNDSNKAEWNIKLAELKAQISAMPVYSSGEQSVDSALSKSQVSILQNYDRDRSSRNLDDMIRRYLASHNPIYEGIIYLQSPYRTLAVFALILALAFDLSGFIFGFVVPEEPRQRESLGRVDTGGAIDKIMNRANGPKWSMLKTLNQYIVLTGDYENKDGVYYYRTFQNGQPYRWAVKDDTAPPYTQGIYQQVQVDTEWSQGTPVSQENQELRFKHQTGGPKDGIYTDCQILYDEGSLDLVQKESQIFLSSVDEYLPVHSYSPQMGANRTIPVKDLASQTINAKKVVAALNAKGTRIAAIYVVEKAK